MVLTLNSHLTLSHHDTVRTGLVEEIYMWVRLCMILKYLFLCLTFNIQYLTLKIKKKSISSLGNVDMDIYMFV